MGKSKRTATMNRSLTTVAFDADDTLWHNERFFKLTQQRFAGLLADYAPRDHLSDRLLAAERRNIGRYGYGIKGFVLSMIETAIEVTDQTFAAERATIDAENRASADVADSIRTELAAWFATRR